MHKNGGGGGGGGGGGRGGELGKFDHVHHDVCIACIVLCEVLIIKLLPSSN